MKHLYCLFLLALLSSMATLHAQDLYIRYDKTCMDNLQYQHNDAAGNANNVLMFRVNKSASEHYQLIAGEGYKKLKKMPKNVVSCNEITFNESFVTAVNAGEQKVFVLTGGSDARDIFSTPIEGANFYYFDRNILKTTGVGYNFNYDFEQPINTNLAEPYSESIVLAAGNSMIYGKTAYTFQSTPLQNPSITYTFNYVPAFGLVTQSNATSSLLLIKVNNIDAVDYMNTLGEYYPPIVAQTQASTIVQIPTTTTTMGNSSTSTTYYPSTTQTTYPQTYPQNYNYTPTYTTSSEVITVPPIYGGEKVIGEGGVMLGITYDYPMTSTSSSSTTTVVSDATVSTSATTAMQPAADLSLTDYQDYIIQTGDNLTNIARRCRVSVNELKVWNGLGDDKIFVGQKIVISDPYKGQSGKYSDLIASKGSDDKSGDDYRDMQMPTAERLKENYVPIYRRTDETQPESYDSRVKPRLVTGKGSGNGGGGDTYTVQKGETIYGLSRRFGMTQEQFRNLNNLGESDLLKVGQVIRIKSIVTKGGSNVEVAPQSYDMRVRPSSQSASNGKQYYEVQPNETISTVARKFGMTVERLRSLNNMTDNEIAVPYQRLMVE